MRGVAVSGVYFIFFFKQGRFTVKAFIGMHVKEEIWCF